MNRLPPLLKDPPRLIVPKTPGVPRRGKEHALLIVWMTVLVILENVFIRIKEDHPKAAQIGAWGCFAAIIWVIHRYWTGVKTRCEKDSAG